MQYPVDEWSRWNNRPARDASGEVDRLSAAPNWTDGAARMPGASLRPSRPLCSKCYGEPCYPVASGGGSAALHAIIAIVGHESDASVQRVSYMIRLQDILLVGRTTPPPLFEQLKRVVIEIPKYRNRPESVCISLLPYRAYMYIDVRVYVAGKPTRKGITIHSDLMPAVLEGMRRALQTSWDALPRQSEPRPAPRQTGISWPTDV